MQYPKQKREQDKKYLEYIRSLPCVVCDMPGEPHHVVSRKAYGSDYKAIPLSREYHSECHSIGKNTFQERYNLDFNEIIIKNLIGYIKRGREK